MKRIMWSYLWIAMAILFAVYGVVIRAVGSGTGFFMIWLVLAAVLLGCGVCARMGLWSGLSPLIRRCVLVVIAAGLIFFLTVESFAVSGFGQKGDRNLDYIIVLGAQIFEDRPSIVLQYRLDEAVRYLGENPGTICIVSGGQGSNEPFPEAVGMKKYLLQKGIPEERILTEEESVNTDQNIANCRAMIPEAASVGIVTNNFHLYRGVLTARKQGMERVCGIAAGSNPFYLPNNLLREFFGILKYWLK